LLESQELQVLHEHQESQAVQEDQVIQELHEFQADSSNEAPLEDIILNSENRGLCHFCFNSNSAINFDSASAKPICKSCETKENQADHSIVQKLSTRCNCSNPKYVFDLEIRKIICVYCGKRS